jgi:mannose-6-phosphate isomerase-like protein (cupin superfamily)
MVHDGIRLVVTGFDIEGRSIVSSDRILPSEQRVLWTTAPPGSADANQDLLVDIPPGIGDPTFPVPGATRFAVVTIAPDADKRAELGQAFDDTTFGMHQTQTIDYVVIISGEIWLKLERGEVRLGAGDCVVQRGTRHAWRNRGRAPCIFAATVLGAFPQPARTSADVSGVA